MISGVRRSEPVEKWDGSTASASPPLPSPPLPRSGPLNPARGSGERCISSPSGSGAKPQKILNLVHIKAAGGIHFNEFPEK